MTNGSCHSTEESNVQTWLNPPSSARAASSTTRLAGGSVCSTTPMSIWPPLSQVLAFAARQEAPASCPPVPLPVTDDDLTARQHGTHPALHLPALIGRVVHRHVVRLRGQHVPQRRIVDDDVGIGAGRDSALAWIEAEHPCRSRRVHLDPARDRQLAVHHTLVQQVDPVLDPWHPIGNLGEIAAAQLLLLLEAERAVVGGDDAQIVRALPLLEACPMQLGT